MQFLPEPSAKYLRDGSIKGVKMGWIWRVSECSLKEFIATGGKPSKKYGEEDQPQ